MTFDVMAEHGLQRVDNMFFRVDADAIAKDIDSPGPRYLVGRCPFHAGDDEPLLVVKKHQMRWYCFECRRIGDVEDVSLRDGKIISRIRA